MNRTSPVGMMLQFAFGPGPGSTKPSNGTAAQVTDVIDHDATAAMLALAAASRAWWESRRPHGWTLEQHLADPAAGCSGAAEERALAEAVARSVRRSC